MRRLNTTKRRLCIGALALVAAPLLLASVASACTQLKNLNANPNRGAPGATITVSGTNYVKTASAGPIEVRLDHRNSAPIATLPVEAIQSVGGVMTMQVTIPATAAVGGHTLIASQRNTSTGATLNGFPVRAAFEVTAPPGGKEATAPAAEGAAASIAGVEPVAGSAPSTGRTTAAAQAPSSEVVPAGDGAVNLGPAAATAAPPAASAGTGMAAGASVVATAAADPTGGGAVAQVSPAVETSTPALVAAQPPSPAVVTSDLTTAAAERSTGVLPEVMLAFGAAMVLLSVAASIRSGRSMLTGRSPASPG